MKSRIKEQGSALHIVIIIILVVAVLGLLGFVFWQNFINKSDDATNTNTDTSSNEQASVDNGQKVSIHPRNQSGEATGDTITLTLPDGWAVERVYEDDDIVKTTSDGKQYLISSAIADSDWTLMENNHVSTGEIIKTVETSKGTQVNIVQTPELLVLTTCQPTGDDCYLNLNGKSLYIHLYWNKPGAQSAVEIDYSSDSAKEIISDFEKIVKSLDI